MTDPFPSRAFFLSLGSTRVTLQLFLGLILTLLSVTRVTATTLPATTVAWKQALPRRAAQLTDFVGINTRLQNKPSAYQNFNSIVIPRLQELGVKHVRDAMINLGEPDTTLWGKYASLARQGIRFLLVADPRGISTMSGVMDSLERSLGFVWAVQGPNELDVGNNINVRYRGATYPNNIRYYQQDLYTSIKRSTNPAIRALPVVGPSFLSYHAADIGPLSCNLGAIHSYPFGKEPSYRLDDLFIPAARIVCPNVPVVATETGYHGALQAVAPVQPAIPETVRAFYVPRLYLEYFRRPQFRRVYLYQLVDDVIDPSHQEENFGLISASGMPKAAFWSLRNLMLHLKDDTPNAATFTPQLLTYRLIGSPPPDLHTLVVQRSNGEYVFFLWRERLSYNLATKQLIDVPSAALRLEVGRTASNISLRRLVNTTVTLISPTRSIPVSVDEDPVVLKFKTY